MVMPVMHVGVPLLYLCLTVPLGFALRGSDGEPHYGSSDAYVYIYIDCNYISSLLYVHVCISS